MRIKLPVKILCQPDDTTCGPTSLHAVYDYYGMPNTLDDIIKSVNYLEDGGTLGVFLACDALKRGLKTTIYSYNLKVLDPVWSTLTEAEILAKLKLQSQVKPWKKLSQTIAAYMHYLEMGGRLAFDDLNPALFKRYLSRGIPILTGLSATYLYNSIREYTDPDNKIVYDDIRGEPVGHFVVLCGLDRQSVLVADPYQDNPLARDHYYRINIQRLINSIMLGVLTYDANLLLIYPGEQL